MEGMLAAPGIRLDTVYRGRRKGILNITKLPSQARPCEQEVHARGAFRRSRTNLRHGPWRGSAGVSRLSLLAQHNVPHYQLSSALYFP